MANGDSPEYNRTEGENSVMIKKNLMTAEELLTLPDDGHSYELVKGELRMMTPAGFEHARIAGRIAVLVGQYANQHELGVILTAEPGFTLTRNPDTVRAPDVAFVRTESIPLESEQKRFAELAPDLVVEVISPSDRMTDLRAKIEEYLDAGVKLIWVVDPGTKSVTEYRPDVAPANFASNDELAGREVLPGFRCKVSEFFA